MLYEKCLDSKDGCKKSLKTLMPTSQTENLLWEMLMHFTKDLQMQKPVSSLLSVGIMVLSCQSKFVLEENGSLSASMNQFTNLRRIFQCELHVIACVRGRALCERFITVAYGEYMLLEVGTLLECQFNDVRWSNLC